jgi:hypothetical protein
MCALDFTDIETSLRKLNEKYPSCSTCQFRGQRVHKVGKRKIPRPTAWCVKHQRPIDYVWLDYTSDRSKRKREVIGDVPCDEYAYEYRPTSLFSHNGRKDDRMVEKS